MTSTLVGSTAITQSQAIQLGQALSECAVAAGIPAEGTTLIGPDLLLLAGDLKSHLQALGQHQYPAPGSATRTPGPTTRNAGAPGT